MGENDSVYGGTGTDIIYGESGNDTVYGGDERDYIEGAVGNDKLYGDDGTDEIEGGIWSDTLYGGNGNDTLEGGESNDYIYAGDGNDIIIEDKGNDRIFGGTGKDYFVFFPGKIGNDTIEDFSRPNSYENFTYIYDFISIVGSNQLDPYEINYASNNGNTIISFTFSSYTESITILNTANVPELFQYQITHFDQPG